MLTRRSLRHVAQSVLCVMLFAQAALAVAACDWLRAAPSQALAPKASEPSCHEEPARNANLCLAHCLGADQSPDTPQISVSALHAAPVLVVARIDVGAAPAARMRHALPRPAAPPPRILFQSFLI